MPITPSPTPSPAVPKGPSIHEILGPMLHGFWLELSQHPYLFPVLGSLVLAQGVTVVRRVAYSGKERDAQRLFSSAQKRLILARAGHQCEWHSLLGRRCKSTQRLQADHIHPYSRGGATDIRNGQALCPHHNRSKAARVPYSHQLKKIAERRAGYAPEGLPTRVSRYRQLS